MPSAILFDSIVSSGILSVQICFNIIVSNRVCDASAQNLFGDSFLNFSGFYFSFYFYFYFSKKNCFKFLFYFFSKFFFICPSNFFQSNILFSNTFLFFVLLEGDDVCKKKYFVF